MKINWNGFLKIAVEKYPEEACGFLFSKNLYSNNEEWFVFPVKNISGIPTEEWIPDKKEMQKIKSKAIKLGLIKIGNVHSHPYYKEWGKFNEEHMRKIIKPSDKDLQFARRFNDIVGLIICVDDKSIYDTYIHDKFGNQINVLLEEKSYKEEIENAKKDR